MSVIVPKRGSRLQLLRMVRKNAEMSFMRKQTLEKNLGDTLEELQRRLRLKRTPRRIECFDVSNIMGTSATGSMVAFVDGKPDKSGYRHFKIRTLSQPDDYGMMYEVLMRRYAKVAGSNGLPDLIMVDGGKGHLQVILEVFKDLKIRGVDAIALAKPQRTSEHMKTGEKVAEKVYIPRIKDPIHLPKHSTATFLLQRIRDESHRFAISYHKKLRKKRDLGSILDEVPGVGKVRKQQLLRHFKTVTRIQNASIEDLLHVSGLNRATAETVYRFLHRGAG